MLALLKVVIQPDPAALKAGGFPRLKLSGDVTRAHPFRTPLTMPAPQPRKNEPRRGKGIAYRLFDGRNPVFWIVPGPTGVALQIELWPDLELRC